MALDVCLRIRSLLQPYCEVVMTRDDDRYVGLTARAEICNRAGCDAFVSYHFNSATSEATGFEVFTTPGRNNSDRLAACIWARHREQFPHQKDRGLKEASYTVIRKANAPAVLVEGEFIHTTSGAAFIGDPRNRERMAIAVAQGVVDFLGLSKPDHLTVEQRLDRIEQHLELS